MRLSELQTGESAVVVKIVGHGGFRRRIMEMGFVRGSRVSVVLNAPLKDPIEYKILDYNISLRRAEAEMIVVINEKDAKKRLQKEMGSIEAVADGSAIESVINRRTHHINVALVGNPNSGKTSLFNQITGEKAHVGNYSGVTVDAKTGHYYYKGYEFHITDLPGTYALSAYTPEELYVRRHLAEHTPDVVLNVVCSSNLARNLYLTTELIDMSQRMVVALNMYDELERNGDVLDHDTLGKMLGVPMIPVVGRTGRGIDEVLDTIIAIHENRDERVRHVHINQGIMEESVAKLNRALKTSSEDLPKCFPPRYFAMKMLEDDKEICQMLEKVGKDYPKWASLCEKEKQHLKYDLGADEDIETVFANQKYGFISGALRETYVQNTNKTDISHMIDEVVTHRAWGYPIFLLLMWLMFYCTFSLGAYPQMWLESLVGMLGDCIESWMPNGVLKDLIIDGIIGGVGSVIVFLPNIMILYFFISFMEDSGYLARAAFIMDKVMHKVGLHGKSFIPLVMGFGCNVPAVLATRTIESRSSRLITILILPFISCSARLPIYILLIGTFFGAYSGTILFGLYLLGIAVALLTALAMRRFMFKVDETPFVMELPPYRIPTLKATTSHMWEKCAQYLRKMGGLILVASLSIWFLSYYPNAGAAESQRQHYENSYIGRIGKACEPIFEPIGMNWKTTVSIISGVAAKEIMVSTLGVLYTEDNAADVSQLDTSSNPITTSAESQSTEPSLYARLVASGDFSVASVLALLVFTLLYFPCVATIAAIAAEGGWKWAAVSVVYNTVVAWVVAFATYHIALLF